MAKGEPDSSNPRAAEESDLSDRLWPIDTRLRGEYGNPEWGSSGDPLDELISTILSQHTSDINTARAFRSLKGRFSDWAEVLDAPTEEVAEAIQSGGLANIKAPRIQRVLRDVEAKLGALSLDALRTMPLPQAREWLLALPGVGPKTAACVLLFSLGLPAMPVDTHVHRVSRRLGLIGASVTANAAHPMLEGLIGPDRDATYALHMNLIAHGRAVCKARAPACSGCVLVDLCPGAMLGGSRV